MRAHKRGAGAGRGLYPGELTTGLKTRVKRSYITVLINKLFEFTRFFKLQKGYTWYLSRAVFPRWGVCHKNSAQLQGIFRE